MAARLILVSALLALFPGCRLIDAASGNSPAAIASRNQENLSRLTIGMSFAAAQGVMGQSGGGLGNSIKNPFRTERAATPDGHGVLVAYYYTLCNADNRISDDELTPVVFVDDKLIGYGRTALATAMGR